MGHDPNQPPICAPPEYGSGRCDTWDDGLGHCAGPASGRPGWCGEPWCYVDNDLCLETGVLVLASSTQPGYFFSYDTCHGDESLWLSWGETDQLKGATLRVAVPMSRHPDNYRLNASGEVIVGMEENRAFGVGPYLGFDAEYFQHLAQVGEYSMNYTLVSRGSLRLHTSWWTACVEDVKRGLLDLCPTATWILPSRTKMADFTSPFHQSRFRLLVKRPRKKDGLSHVALLMFRPFTPGAWGMIAASIALVAVLRKCLADVRVTDDARPKADRGRGEVAPPEARAEPRAASVEALLRGVAVQIYQLADSWYEAALNFLQGGVEFEKAHPAAERALQLGFAVFILATLTLYTAELTAGQVATTLEYDIKSIDDCAAKACKVCYPSQGIGLGDMFRSRFDTKIKWMSSPKVATTTESQSWIMEHLRLGGEAGGCDAAAMDSDTYAQVGMSNCDVQWVPGTLVAIQMGAPVSPKYAKGISHVMRVSGTTVMIDQYIQLRKKHIPAVECDGYVSDSENKEDGEEPVQATAAHLIGPCAALLISVAVAIGCESFSRAHRRCHRGAAQDLHRGAGV